MLHQYTGLLELAWSLVFEAIHKKVGCELKSGVTKLPQKTLIYIGRTIAKYKHTHTTFLEAFNEQLAKHLFKPMDTQELLEPEKVSAIWLYWCKTKRCD